MGYKEKKKKKPRVYRLLASVKTVRDSIGYVKQTAHDIFFPNPGGPIHTTPLQ